MTTEQFYNNLKTLCLLMSQNNNYFAVGSIQLEEFPTDINECYIHSDMHRIYFRFFHDDLDFEYNIQGNILYTFSYGVRTSWKNYKYQYTKYVNFLDVDKMKITILPKYKRLLKKMMIVMQKNCTIPLEKFFEKYMIDLL